MIESGKDGDGRVDPTEVAGGQPPAKRPRPDAAEVKSMSSRKYMDELVVPHLLKGLAAVNKQVEE